MMGEMSLDDWDEKSMKNNDQEEVDGKRQSKVKVKVNVDLYNASSLKPHL